MIEHRRRRRANDETAINITPLLDIVFILLIFFIVTTSFVKEFGVEMSRPSNSPVQEQKRAEAVVVRIDEAGVVWVGDRPVEIDALRANIESALAVKPEAPVVVVADRVAAAGLTVRVVDQARVAGAEKVSLAAPEQR